MPPLRAWADIAVLSLLSVLGVLGFEASFGGNGYLAAGIGGLVVGVAAGMLAYLLRLAALPTLLLAIAAYFLFGSAIAVPDQALLGFLPGVQSLASLATGAVFGWADILTLKTPIGAPVYIGAVPYVATWLVGLVFTVLATRWLTTRPRTAWRSGLVLAGPIALYLVGILIGTHDAYLAGVRGVTFAVVALVWLGWRRTASDKAAKSSGDSLLRRKLVGTAVVVVASVVIGATIGALVAPTAFNRFVLRDEIQPPFDPLDYPSPLAGFRHFTKDAAKIQLFTVKGLAPGQRIRMATMDSYTGKLWNVAGPEVATDGSGSFNLVGGAMPEPALATIDGRNTVTFTINGYSDVWMPSVGYPEKVSFAGGSAVAGDNLRYNASTGALVLTSGVKEGMTYTITADRQKEYSIGELSDKAPAALPLPPVDDVPDIVNAKADEFAGDASTPIAKLTLIEQTFKTEGYLSHGLASDSVKSQAGHGADRMNLLLTREPMVGDQEQYASAFALMARHLGYPARVVMGFVPKSSDQVTVHGSDVTAWVEVAFEGVGWVPFDPTPEQTDAPQEQTTTPKSEPLPQVRQPPRANQEQNNLLSPVAIDKSKDDDKAGFEIPGWAYAVAGGIGIPLLLYFVPVLIVGALKRRRIKKRRASGEGDARVAGAWNELVDTYAELGYALNRKHSRMQTAAAIQAQFADQLDRRRSDRDRLEQARLERDTDRQSRKQREGKATAAAVLGSTAVLVKGMTAWRPGVASVDEELPGMPELYGIAESVDEAVFSGRQVDDATVESAWASALDSAKDARRSVSWTRRQLSKFRIRSKRDWLDVLAKAGGLTMPQLLKGARRS
jgi:transglutaminase-like putative cysteine protease